MSGLPRLVLLPIRTTIAVLDAYKLRAYKILKEKVNKKNDNGEQRVFFGGNFRQHYAHPTIEECPSRIILCTYLRGHIYVRREEIMRVGRKREGQLSASPVYSCIIQSELD